MDKITEAKTEFRLRQWTQIIQEYQSSGMTVTNWCKQHNINTKSYYYWLRRIRAMACESETLLQKPTHQQIVPVAFKPSKATAAVTIHLPSISVDIHDGASRTTIEAVLASLKSIC